MGRDYPPLTSQKDNMSWTTTTLSTAATIARHEKEIEAQGGATQRKAIYVPALTTIKFSTAGFATCTYATFTYSDLSTANVNVVASEVTLPTAKYIYQIDLYTAANVLLYTFDCLEGYGAALASTAGAKTLTLYSGTGNWGEGWQTTSTTGDFSWTDKIELVKDIIKNAIETKLFERGHTVNYAGGDVLIDIVTNPEEFILASDYLTLHKIYVDLGNGGFNQLYEDKQKYYRLEYDAEFSNAMKRINLDPSLSGTTTEYRANITGRISR